MEIYKDILNTIKEPIACLDTKFNYVYVNSAYANFYNCPPNEIMGKPIDEIIGIAFFNNNVKPMFEKYLNNGQLEKNAVITFKNSSNGSRLSMTVNVRYTDQKKVDAFILTSYDSTKEELKVNNRRYRKAQEIGKVANWEYNLQTTEFWGSEQAKRIYGLDPNSKSFSTEEIESCIPERERVHQALIDLIEHDKPYNLEFDIITKLQKQRKTIISIAELERDSDGSPLKITGVIQDVTERRKALAQLEKSSIIINSANDAIISTDVDGNITFWNQGAQTIFGFAPEEIIGKSVKTIYKEKDYPVLNELINKLITGNSIRNVEVVCIDKQKNDVFILLSLTTVKDENGNIVELVGITKDITQQRRQQMALEESEEKFRTIFQMAISFICIADINEIKFKLVNPTFSRVLGYSEEELLGKSFLEFVHPDDVQATVDIIQRELHKGNKVFSYQNRYRCKDGSYRWLDWNSWPISNKGITYAIANDITEQKETEMAIRESELKFRTLFEESNDAVFIHDTNDIIIDVNKQATKIFGYKREEFIGNSVLNFHPQSEIEKLKVFKRESLKNKVHQAESKYISKSGKLIDVEINSRLFDKEKGLVQGILRDISERKKTEQKILKQNLEFETLNEELKQTNLELYNSKLKTEEEERKLKTLIGNLQGVAYQCNYDQHWTMTFLSEGVVDLTGYNIDELINNNSLSWSDLILKEHNEYISEKVDYAITHKQTFTLEYEIRCKNSEIKWVWEKGTAIFKNGRVSHLEGFITDITPLKNFEKELSEHRLKLEKIFLIAPTGIGQVKNRVITYVNNKIVDMTGYQADELINQSSLMIYPSKEEFDYVGKEKYRQIREHGTGVVETKWKRKNGEIIDVLLASVALDVNDLSKGSIFTALNITPRKNYERELKEKNKELQETNAKLYEAKEKSEEANRLKTEFLQNMSHEVRTPMNGIIGFTEMLEDFNLTAEKRNYYTKIVKSSCHQLLKIIDDILEISTLEVKKKEVTEEEICLNDFLMGLFSIFSLKSKEQNIPIYIKKALNDEDSYLLSDRSKLDKILGNLIENAFKYTIEGYIEIGYTIEKQNLVLYVKDTGVGIPAENQESIFERFQQGEKEISRKQGGLGLGLAIAKENAELLGGNISLETETGKGSTFYISVPYKPVNTKSESISDSASGSVNGAHKLTILVAEDEEINYLYIEAVLKKHMKLDSTIIHAKNGQEAVDMCLAAEHIDLILMDIKMPILNGYDATNLIKAVRPEIPIIAQTAYATPADKKLAFENGCNDYIAKPIEKEDLFDLIGKYTSWKK